MIRAIKNWFFKRWVLSVIGEDRLIRPYYLRLYSNAYLSPEDREGYFYQAKEVLRKMLPSADLIELAEGALTIVKGDRTARIEV